MITPAQDTGGKDRRRYKLVSGDCEYYRAASPSPTIATPSRISPRPAILRPVKASLKNRRAHRIVQIYPSATIGYSTGRCPTRNPHPKITDDPSYTATPNTN